MISPLAYVSPEARIADDVIIHPFAYIDANVTIGPGCEIMPYASIMGGTTLGCNNKIYNGAVIGADPQDFRWKGQQTYCIIGDNNRIREQTIINRGIHPDGATRIGSNCFIMAETHIGHDSQIYDGCVLGNGVKIAGDVHVGKHTILSSAVILHEGSHIGSHVLIKGGTRISGHVPPFVIMAHNPARYYGVNSYIMSKCGYSDAAIDDVAKAYRHIYQCGISVFNALGRIRADIDPNEVRNAITGFIESHNLKIAGDTFDED